MLSPCWHVVPAGSARIAVQAPLAHCWYCSPTQLKVPSSEQVPDLVVPLDVELPPEPEPVAVAEADEEVSVEERRVEEEEVAEEEETALLVVTNVAEVSV